MIQQAYKVIARTLFREADRLSLQIAAISQLSKMIAAEWDKTGGGL